MKFINALWIILIIISCDQIQRSRSQDPQAKLNGQELSKSYCSSCHLYPEPSLLDSITWQQHVLPRMGYMMGIYEHDSVRPLLMESGLAAQKVLDANVFPEEPVLTAQEWAAIRGFYSRTAPKALTTPQSTSLETTLFKPHKPEVRMSPPSTTMVHFGNEGLYVADAHSESLLLFNKDQKLKRVAKIKEGGVNLLETPQTLELLVMGSFSPTDQPQGLWLSIPKDTTYKTLKTLSALQRPVHSDLGDLNGDLKPDLVVCEFGKWTGTLSWFEQTDSGFKKHLLKARPGATKAYLRDINQDQHLDIVALFAQGDEFISIFYNDGKGNFTEDQVIRFSPAHGSSSMELVDFNQDGSWDILYTAGDNADYPPIIKPYHGIYLYLNNGSNEFTEFMFYPLPGAYGAKLFDYDQDGDLDLAAIAFFPDFTQIPRKSFVFLEHQSEWKFKAQVVANLPDGRWMVMDHGDPDGDGDQDLVLGSLAFEVLPEMGLVKKWTEEGIPYVFLENTSSIKGAEAPLNTY